MNAKLTLLAKRREHLIERAAAQRMALAQYMTPWHLPLARVDHGLAALSYLRRHPVWIIGGGILLAALRIRRAGKWLARGWVAWRMLQPFRGG